MRLYHISKLQNMVWQLLSRPPQMEESNRNSTLITQRYFSKKKHLVKHKVKV